MSSLVNKRINIFFYHKLKICFHQFLIKCHTNQSLVVNWNVSIYFRSHLLRLFRFLLSHLQSISTVFKARSSRTKTDVSLWKHKKLNFERTKYRLWRGRCLSVKIEAWSPTKCYHSNLFLVSLKIKRQFLAFLQCSRLIFLQLIPSCWSKCLSKILKNSATTILL